MAHCGIIQAQGFDPVRFYEARQAIRPGKEQEAENRAQQAQKGQQTFQQKKRGRRIND